MSACCKKAVYQNIFYATFVFGSFEIRMPKCAELKVFTQLLAFFKN